MSSEFDEFLENWDPEFKGHRPPYIKEKKEILDKSKKKIPATGPTKSSYKNVWELFADNGISPADVAQMDVIGYDAIHMLIKEVNVRLFNDDEVGFRNVHLNKPQMPEDMDLEKKKEPFKDIFKDVKF